jgi:hypothetical protein
MTKRQKTPGLQKPWRLTTPPEIRPLDPDKPLAPQRVPPLPAGKFEHVPGQQAIDFSSDDPDALVDPEAEGAA